jgi:hypothetical protein
MSPTESGVFNAIGPTSSPAQDMVQCEREAARLTAEYGRIPDEKERSKVKESLAKVLEKEFDLHQKARSQEIEQIEARVKRLRNLMDKRNQARKTIVNARLDQLIRDSEGLGWTPNSTPTVIETQTQGVRGIRQTNAYGVANPSGGGSGGGAAYTVTVPAPGATGGIRSRPVDPNASAIELAPGSSPSPGPAIKRP